LSGATVTESNAILLAGGSQRAADEILDLLQSKGFEVTRGQVETPNELRAVLQRRAWQFVLFDAGTSQIAAPEAAALLGEVAPAVPLIIIAEATAEHEALQAMRLGARDYVLERDLRRLPAIIDREVRDRTRAGGTLRANEEGLRLLLESTGEAVYGLDMQGQCIFANEACVRMLGYADGKDLIGLNMHEVAHHTRPNATPYPLRTCRICQAELAGEGIHVGEEVLWRADGTSFAVEYHSFPLRLGKAHLGVVIGFVDITARKKVENELRRTEERLRHSEARFRTLGEKSRMAVAIVVGLVAVVAVLAAIVGMPSMQEGHYWPFSTGTSVSAFWGATFEMSPPEVSRATHCRLAETPPQDENDALGFLWGSFAYVDPEIERLTTRRYAEGVSLFEMPGFLLLEFLDERLVGVNGAFRPREAERAKFVEKVAGALTTRFGILHRQERARDTSATNYEWKRDGITASMWVPDGPKRSVTFLIHYPAVQERLEAKRRQRDSKTFGP
jgi:PAS domain S-box-containing protein